ncbi:ATP-binding cassette domain-containing protein [Alkalicoccus chagannorensis]|uniref:ATP-binding cassette domain-containing protein n=1 Tax=Alkalicoccus chagannorensis TaxID=427072 RepID=UPI00041F2491|nr:ATP-binding cassette domain-containing protein [Alkalicoccus chagannorensis]
MVYAVHWLNVEKKFKTEDGMRTLFYQADWRVNQGEIVQLSGPVRSGRSTALRMTAAMTPPNKGSVTVLGEDTMQLADRASWRRNHIGFVNDEAALNTEMSVRENLSFGPSAPDASRIERVLDDLHFTGDERTDEIAGLDREAQLRAVAAKILLEEPRLMLLDAPGSDLTPEQRRFLIEHIIAAARHHDAALVFASNDASCAGLMDRLLEIKEQRIVESGKVFQEEGE